MASRAGTRIRAPSEDPPELLRTLLRFDTSNPPGNERACIQFVGELLRGAGLEPVFRAAHADRPNVVARLGGRGEAPPLLLHGHVDVVPAGLEEWTQPPFAANLVDGEVWGRGALDMKGGVAMFLAAMLRAARETLVPAGDVVLVLMSDEEAGSQLGAAYLVREHSKYFRNVRHGLSEFGGFTQWTAGRPLYPVQVSEKQRCLVRATVEGKSGHAATVVRDSATSKAGRLLLRLAERRLPVHVTPIVRRMVKAMASALPLHQRLALRPLLSPPFTDRVLDVLGNAADPLGPLLHNTATPVRVRGGNGANVVPSQLEVDLDGRVLPGQEPADLVRELDDLARGLATFELVHEEPAVRPDPDMALYPLLADVLRAHDTRGTPIPMLLPAYTDARYFAQLGIQTYGFTPMRLPPHITTDLIHAADERIPAAAVEFGADCVYEVIRRYRG